MDQQPYYDAWTVWDTGIADVGNTGDLCFSISQTGLNDIEPPLVNLFDIPDPPDHGVQGMSDLNYPSVDQRFLDFSDSELDELARVALSSSYPGLPALESLDVPMIPLISDLPSLSPAGIDDFDGHSNNSMDITTGTSILALSTPISSHTVFCLPTSLPSPVTPVSMEEREVSMSLPVAISYQVSSPAMSPKPSPADQRGTDRPKTPARVIRRRTKPVKCPDCEHRFPFKAEMTRHYNALHKDVTRIQCEWCPSKSYKRKDHLLRHLTKKHGRPYKRMKKRA